MPNIGQATGIQADAANGQVSEEKPSGSNLGTKLHVKKHYHLLNH